MDVSLRELSHPSFRMVILHSGINPGSGLMIKTPPSESAAGSETRRNTPVDMPPSRSRTRSTESWIQHSESRGEFEAAVMIFAFFWLKLSLT